MFREWPVGERSVLSILDSARAKTMVTKMWLSLETLKLPRNIGETTPFLPLFLSSGRARRGAVG